MNVACRLYSDDLRDDGGTWTLRIASDPERQQETKMNEARTVGFLEFAKARLDGTQGPLFPELVLDRHGSATNAYSKWFARLQAGVGLKRRGLVFHSLRHRALEARGVQTPKGQTRWAPAQVRRVLAST